VEATVVAHSYISAAFAGLIALVLFAYGRTGHRRGFLLLASLYLSYGVMILTFPLFFEGAFLADEVIMGGTQSAPMLAIFLLYIFTIGIPVVAVLINRDQQRRGSADARRQGIGWWVATSLILSGLVVGWLALFPETVPTVLDADGQGLPWVRVVLGVFNPLLSLIGLVVVGLAARSGSIIGVWLFMVSMALLANGVLLLNLTGRYTLGWYYVRIFTLVVLLVLLVALILRIDGIQRRNATIAQVDRLTGVQSRERLIQSMSEALNLMPLRGNRPALLWVNINGFHDINDQFGHAAGDQVLVEVANRLVAAAPGASVGRVGGDDFAVMLDHAEGDKATAVAEEFVAAVGSPMTVAQDRIVVSASVGVAAVADPGTTAEEWMFQADRAVMEAKKSQRGSFAAFDQEMAQSAQERAALGQQMASALRRGDDFVLWYQPIVQPETARWVGAEALVRWKHGGRFVPASEFVTLAQEMRNAALGEIVIKRLAESGPLLLADADPDFFLTFNLSPWESRYHGVIDALGREPLTEIAHRCYVEVTESFQLHESELALQNLQLLQELGYRLAIDDFGTGYSNLARLELLRPSLLKIDRSLVAKAGAGALDGVELMRAARNLGNSLGAAVLAEGIETTDEHQVVLDLDLPLAQGFRYARPMPAADFLRFRAGGRVPAMPPQREA
jgi:diguanylate cyclase (GGDEF)-like protein